MVNAPWYSTGLRFGCKRCGRCCGGGPGTIRVSDDEIAALAARFGQGDTEFRKRYTRRLRGGEISLIEKKNLDCIFYDAERGCSVYADRPRQCRTWPFWRAVVHSSETWAEEAKRCPGIDLGPRHSAREIAEALEDDGTSACRRRRRSASRRRRTATTGRRSEDAMR